MTKPVPGVHESTVERLRERAESGKVANPYNLLLDAAEEITRLQKELETAREDALEEAAKVAESANVYELPSHAHIVAEAIRALQKKEATE